MLHANTYTNTRLLLLLLLVLQRGCTLWKRWLSVSCFLLVTERLWCTLLLLLLLLGERLSLSPRTVGCAYCSRCAGLWHNCGSWAASSICVESLLLLMLLVVSLLVELSECYWCSLLLRASCHR